MHNHEGLQGPQSEDRERVEEELSANGEPLWMAFLDDPEALSVSKEEAQDAKNKLLEMQQENPEVISLCKHKTIEECRHLVHPAEAA